MLVDNAVIMAAGTSSRFAPLSYERHKGLTEVRGEVLIERQIRQSSTTCPASSACTCCITPAT